MQNIIAIILISTLLLTACGQRPPEITNALDPSPTVQSSNESIPKVETPITTEMPTENIPQAVTPTAISQPVPTPTRANPLRPPTQPIFGIYVFNLNTSNQMQLANQAGGYWLRVDTFHWDKIEPLDTEPPAYDWSSVNEQALIEATEMGMQVIGLIQFTPHWAQKYPGYSCGPVAEEHFESFSKFMEALAGRYSQPPYNVHYWEIGNEPDIHRDLVRPDSGFGCWGELDAPLYGGGYYGEMLKVVYPRIKAADPEANVMVGGLTLDCDPVNPPESPPGSGQMKDCTPSRFLEGILGMGGGDFFDGVSYHAYDYYYGFEGGIHYGNGNWHASWDTTGPVLVPKTRYLKGLLTAHGHPDKFLMNTEVGLLCGNSGKEEYCLDENFDKAKAYYAAQANASALAENLAANLWFTLRGWRGSGLVDGNLQPIPAYDAYRFSTTQLSQAAFVSDVKQFSGVRGFEFRRGDTLLWILWANDDQRHSILLEKLPSEIFDVYGNPLAVNQDFTIAEMPVYIEWIP